MSLLSSKMTYKVFSIATGMLTAAATGVIARSAWKAFRNDPPPDHPENPDTQWKDAVIWTVATALTAGITRMLVMRSANQGWRVITGDLPPQVQPA